MGQGPGKVGRRKEWNMGEVRAWAGRRRNHEAERRSMEKRESHARE